MNHSNKRKWCLLLVMLMFSMVADAQLKKIVFAPQWHANIQFAGYIVARELGYYRDEGLDVTIKYPGGAKSSLELLRDGQADLSAAFLMNAIEAKSKNEIDLLNVMQTSQHASICLALKSPVDELTMEKLSGMRVGVWSSRTSISAQAMNKRYSLKWDVVPFRYDIKLLTYGVLDAITVMEYNELLRLKYTGREVSEHSVFKLCEHGYDIPEEGVYCLSEYYRQNADAVKAFVRASKKGWEWCRKHPEQTVDLVTKEMDKEYVNNTKVLQAAGLKVVLKKQEQTPGKVTYTLLKEQFDKAAHTLQDVDIITVIPDFKTFVAR